MLFAGGRKIVEGELWSGLIDGVGAFGEQGEAGGGRIAWRVYPGVAHLNSYSLQLLETESG